VSRIIFAACAVAVSSLTVPLAAQTGAPVQTATVPEAVKPLADPMPDVVARVNGEPVSKSDLETAITQIESRAGQQMPAEQRPQIVRGLLDQLIAYQLLLQETIARKVVITDADLEARITDLKAQFPSEEAFAQALQQQQVTIEEVRVNLRQGMQIDRMMDAELATRAAVTPEQIAGFYAGNPNEFQQKERVRARHVLIRVPDGGDAAAKEQARVKAADLLAKIKAGGDFAALAKEFSDDPGSGAQGGDLGYFERGQMVGPFDEAAFTLPPAQTSDLVETQFGFHIIQVEDRQAARTVPLEEVRAEIEKFLQGRTREEQSQAFIDSLRAKANVEIYI
jgi:peptidyl-prolyl cis-trans isomerase C